jgi:hypothetical protein
MKTIKTSCQITSLSSRNDGSLRLSVVTPELSVEEKVAVMELQGQLLQALFIPEEFQAEQMEIGKDLDGKSPSSRLRNVLFVWWKKLEENNKTKDDFSLWYRNKMESIIDGVKLKIEELEE